MLEGSLSTNNPQKGQASICVSRLHLHTVVANSYAGLSIGKRETRSGQPDGELGAEERRDVQQVHKQVRSQLSNGCNPTDNQHCHDFGKLYSILLSYNLIISIHSFGPLYHLR